MNVNLKSILVGIAGEYLVAGELTLWGYLASITLRNSRGIDIIASNSDATKSVSIQVKTNNTGKPIWLLNKNAEEVNTKNHYYIFVALDALGKRPRYYIVPSKIVAGFIKKNHREWLLGAKKDGSQRKDNNIRKFSDKESKYLEKWELLFL